MINIEKLLLESSKNQLDYDLIDKKFNEFSLSEDLTNDNLGKINTNSKHFLAILKLGYMAIVTNQNEKSNIKDKNIYEREFSQRLYAKFNAKFELISEVFELYSKEKLDLDSNNLRILYSNLVKIKNESVNLISSVEELFERELISFETSQEILDSIEFKLKISDNIRKKIFTKIDEMDKFKFKNSNQLTM